MKLIELKDIFKTYHLAEIDVPVLKGVSFTVSQGEYVALMGTSGSGKTTLMNILGCLDRPTSGQYWLDGVEVSGLSSDERAQLRNKKLGFVFQTFNLLPRTSALENVTMPLSYNGADVADQEELQRASGLLQRVGLGTRLDHEPSQLSGGQQQRVAIARALINNPSLLLADEPTGNLDSRTSDEMLDLFKRLNEEGVTIILVTHDEQVARSTKRIIRIHDGVVATDEAAPRVTASEPGIEAPRHVNRLAMPRFRAMMRTAVLGLRRNIMRAALTALGIIIGVAAVIAMMEIGRGSSTAIQRTIASMGANNLLIMPGTAASGGVSFGAGSVKTLTPQDAEAIAQELSTVLATAPVVRARTQVIYGNRNWVPIYIYGTTPSFLEVRQWPLAAGEIFTDQDVRNGSKVCLLGERLVKELFEGQSPLGKEVRVNNVAFKVIGVLSPKGANMIGIDQDDILIAPWTAIKYRVAGSSLATVNQSAREGQSSSGSDTSPKVNTLNQIYPSSQVRLYPEQSAVQQANTPMPIRFSNVDQVQVAVRSTEDIPIAIKQITQLLRERHRIKPSEPEDFAIRDMTEMTNTLSSTANLMTKLLLAVALISLVVGGVGIMNIMMVSVTERTREIGLRMAVGAWRRDILQQFLLEAVLLCFCGGIVGILLGRGISMVIRAVLRWPTELSIGAILVAFAVSVTVGVIFGYYPAWKASRLDPIHALRYE